MENVSNYIQKYIQLKYKLFQYEAVEKIGNARAHLILKSFIILMFFNGLTFAGLTLSFYLGKILGSFYIGFGIVSCLFLVLTITLYLFRKKLIKVFLNRFLNNNMPI